MIITNGGQIANVDFDLSSLTQISDGWTSGSICKWELKYDAIMIVTFGL